MERLNCWEFRKCHRESEGSRVAELGACPASTETKVDGINGGKNAGRACWAISGTLCGGRPSGSFVVKITDCLQCKFYQHVLHEEGAQFKMSKEILSKLRKEGN